MKPSYGKVSMDQFWSSRFRSNSETSGLHLWTWHANFENNPTKLIKILCMLQCSHELCGMWEMPIVGKTSSQWSSNSFESSLLRSWNACMLQTLLLSLSPSLILIFSNIFSFFFYIFCKPNNGLPWWLGFNGFGSQSIFIFLKFVQVMFAFAW